MDTEAFGQGLEVELAAKMKCCDGLVVVVLMLHTEADFASATVLAASSKRVK